MPETLLKILASPGLDEFRPVRFHGSEGLSQLFHHELELHAEGGGPLDADALAEQLLGHPVAIGLRLADGRFRPFRGIVTRLALDDERRILRLELAPKLWLLGLSSDCRNFAGKDVAEITRAVLAGHNFLPEDFSIRIGKDYPKYEHCVQYRETDLNFLRRLWEQEGLIFFFRVDITGDTLVLTDDPELIGEPEVKVVPRRAPTALDSFGEADAVHSWKHVREVRPASYALTARDWRAPEADLNPVANADVAPGGTGSMYDLGEYVDPRQGKRYAAIRLEEESLSRRSGTGSGNVRDLAPGLRFRFHRAAPSDPMLAALAGAVGAPDLSYRILDVCHEAREASAEEAGMYHNTFTAVPVDVTIRPARSTPRPAIAGVFFGVVVAEDGRPERGDGPEVVLDQAGRARVRLHWDRADAAAEPLRARVSQAWAGRGFGAWFPTRVGQEVVIAFEEGDPDRPVIVGSVFMTAADLPFGPASTKTACGLRTHSSPDQASAHGSELSFDDDAGREQVRLVSQKDLITHVRNDHRTVVDRDQARFVKQDQVERIGRDQRRTIGGNRAEKVGQDSKLEVLGALFEKIGGAFGLHAGGSVTLKAGPEFVITAGTKISLIVGGNHVTIGPDGVRINGTMVMLNCAGGQPAEAAAVTVGELAEGEHPQVPRHRQEGAN